MSFKVTGTGSAHPSFALTNEMLTGMLDTSDEWIQSRTGIQSRYIVTDETLTGLATEAALAALTRSGTGPRELDLIICATIGGEYLTPSLACMVQKEIGALCPAFDVNAACPGFIYALDIAAAYFESGRVNRVLVVAAELMSSRVDWTDRATCVLFGDGAGAVVLEPGDGLLGTQLSTRGGEKWLNIPSFPGQSPFTKNKGMAPCLRMNGGEVYKFAVNSICSDMKSVMKKACLEAADFTKFLPHQANARIIHAAAAASGFSREQTAVNVDRYGNTSSASIPTLLDELVTGGELVPGDIILMAAMGGGLTSGACAIKL